MNLAGVFDGRNAARGWRVRAEHLDDIAVAGFTTVRLPVCWWGYAQSSYPYRLDGRILDAVEAVLGEAWARDLAVVLTMHHADAVYGDPQGSVDQLVAIWRQIAERFAAATGALAFELLNEPHPPMTPGQWNALLPTVLGGVRDVDANRLVVIGGAEGSTVGSLRHLELPPDDHLLATVHYYQPFHFTHQGAPWQVGAAAWLGTGWGPAADRAAVTSDLAEAVAWSQRARVPLYVGEFGALDRADQGSRVRWTHWVRRNSTASDYRGPTGTSAPTSEPMTSVATRGARICSMPSPGNRPAMTPRRITTARAPNRERPRPSIIFARRTHR